MVIRLDAAPHSTHVCVPPWLVTPILILILTLTLTLTLTPSLDATVVYLPISDEHLQNVTPLLDPKMAGWSIPTIPKTRVSVSLGFVAMRL